MQQILPVAAQLFFLLTPFLVLSLFLSLTNNMSQGKQRKLALRSTLAIFVVAAAVYLVGKQLFALLGITIDAFRIGAGIVLLLAGIEVVRSPGVPAARRTPDDPDRDDDGDIAVVPMAIPYTVGPGTIGALMVMSAVADSVEQRLADLAALAIAVAAIGVLLFFSSFLERILKPKGISIFSKLTGLFLAALAAQIIFVGIDNFLLAKYNIQIK